MQVSAARRNNSINRPFGLIRLRFAPLQKRPVLAESEGGKGQPNLNPISPRISIR